MVVCKDFILLTMMQINCWNNGNESACKMKIDGMGLVYHL